MAAAEDLVDALEQVTSMFELSDDLELFKAGLADIVKRLQALEKKEK